MSLSVLQLTQAALREQREKNFNLQAILDKVLREWTIESLQDKRRIGEKTEINTTLSARIDRARALVEKVDISPTQARLDILRALVGVDHG